MKPRAGCNSLPMITVVIITAVFISSTAAAVPVTCEFRNDGRATFETLLKLIRNPECQIKSIDDLLARLPQEIRTFPVTIYRSQSLQGPHTPDYLNPRIILSTKFSVNDFLQNRSELKISFNGSPFQPGFRNLEILEIDKNAPKPSAAVHKYFEVEFPSDEDAKKITWENAQKLIQPTKANPAKCIACHGNPARPIFQGYPIWTGAYGSFHFRVDPLELENFNKFKEKIAIDKGSRYRHLNYETASSDRILRGDVNSEFNSDLASSNSLRVARLIQQTPDYDKFRYAIAGALLDCASYADFFPQRLRSQLESNIKQTFDSQKTAQAADKILKSFWDAGSSQFGGFSEMLSVARGEVISPVQDFPPFNTFVGELKRYWQNSSELFGLWVDTIDKQGQQRSTPMPTKARFVFEARGIDISNWFIDLKQPTYRIMSGQDGGEHWGWMLLHDDAKGFQKFRNQFAEAKGFPFPQPMPIPLTLPESRKKLCEDLKTESLAILKDQSDLPPLNAERSGNLGKRKPYPVTFINTCARCHVELRIAPYIPFSDRNAFKIWVQSPGNLKKIQYRLSAPNDDRMPPTRFLDPDELEDIKTYLNSI